MTDRLIQQALLQVLQQSLVQRMKAQQAAAAAAESGRDPDTLRWTAVGITAVDPDRERFEGLVRTLRAELDATARENGEDD